MVIGMTAPFSLLYTLETVQAAEDVADKYKSNSKPRKRQSTKQPMVPKGLIDRLRGIIFSSKAVNRIVERLTFDVIFIEGESSAADDAFYKKTLASNATLLQVFKEDAELFQQFKCQLALGQQRLREQNEHQRSGSMNSVNALAA